MLRCAQHDENQDCMTFCRHPEPFKGEGSSEVLVMKNNWMLRLRLSMTRVEPPRFVIWPFGPNYKRTSGGVQPEVRGMGLGVPLN